jgi:inorganic phosphate transporter, PiT family
MSIALVVFIVFAGLYVGWNIGANDSANCIGASVGAGLVRYRTGIILVSVFVVAGALTGGDGVIKTLGKGIVTDTLAPLGVVVALICGGLFVTAATFFKVPVSTSQGVVGGVAGVGMAAGLNVDFSKVLTIVECWILCPILSMIFSYAIYKVCRLVLSKVKNKTRADRVLTYLVLGSACYAAFALGANNLGNAIGPIVVLEGVESFISIGVLTILGALSIAVGALTFGRGVAETVGKSITRLNLQGAFAAQMASAFGLHLFSMFGIPVSTSQTIVGAVLGVGLVHGARSVSRRKLVEIVIGWVLTPTMAGLVSFGIYHIVSRLV